MTLIMDSGAIHATRAGNLYALCIERSCSQLVDTWFALGMIVQLSVAICTDRMEQLRSSQHKAVQLTSVFASYDDRPSKLIRRRNTFELPIFFAARQTINLQKFGLRIFCGGITSDVRDG